MAGLEPGQVDAVLVGDEDLEAEALMVGEGELSAGMRPFASTDGAGSLGPGRQVEVGQLADSGALALLAGLGDSRHPGALGHGQDGLANGLDEIEADRGADLERAQLVHEVVCGAADSTLSPTNLGQTTHSVLFADHLHSRLLFGMERRGGAYLSHTTTRRRMSVGRRLLTLLKWTAGSAIGFPFFGLCVFIEYDPDRGHGIVGWFRDYFIFNFQMGVVLTVLGTIIGFLIGTAVAIRGRES